MEFDDVRPTTAWLSYLFSMPGIDSRQTWQIIQPAFLRIINHLRRDEEIKKTLAQSGAVNRLVQMVIVGFLKHGLFRRKFPFWIIKLFMPLVSRSINLKSQVTWARGESLVKDKNMGCQCVVSGHTHFAEAALISGSLGNDRYYLNTGTWRNVIPATQNFKEFGRLNAITKIVIFLPQEKNEPVSYTHLRAHET